MGGFALYTSIRPTKVCKFGAEEVSKVRLQLLESTIGGRYMLFCEKCGEGVSVALRCYILNEETSRVNEITLCRTCLEDVEE